MNCIPEMINIVTFAKRYFLILLIGIVCIATIIAYAKLSGTEWFENLLLWSGNNLFWFILILFLIKMIGVVWPPLPGIIFTMASIPVLGWPLAYAVDFTAGMSGAALSFWLSRRYGQGVVLKLFGQAGLDQVKRFQFRPDNELEAVLVIRLFTGSLSELVNYGAGLTKMRFFNFITGTVISYLVVGISIFYLASLLFSTNNLLFGVIPLVVGLTILYLLRNRYFLWTD